MRYTKASYWEFHQNSYTYWFVCPSCGYGRYDGWAGGNQEKSEYCPECGKHMFYNKLLSCHDCPKNTAVMCIHTDMENPFGEIKEDGCRDGCPKIYKGES